MTDAGHARGPCASSLLIETVAVVHKDTRRSKKVGLNTFGRRDKLTTLFSSRHGLFMVVKMYTFGKTQYTTHILSVKKSLRRWCIHPWDTCF
jgi:hypothetical protein